MHSHDLACIRGSVYNTVITYSGSSNSAVRGIFHCLSHFDTIIVEFIYTFLSEWPLPFPGMVMNGTEGAAGSLGFQSLPCNCSCTHCGFVVSAYSEKSTVAAVQGSGCRDSR